MPNESLLARIIVLEKEVDKAFFGHYRHMAGLMGVDDSIDEKDWLIIKGPIGNIASWAVNNHPKGNEMMEKHGLKGYLNSFMMEYYRNKLGMPPESPEIRAMFLESTNSLIQESKLQTRPSPASFTSSEDVLVLTRNMLDMHTISHEAGHALFERKSSVPNRLHYKGTLVDSELFAIYSSDIALRMKGMDVVTFVEAEVKKMTSGGHEMAFNIYRGILDAYEGSTGDVTGHMRDFFHGRRGMADFISK
ncbi:MAG: hypothetical protein V1906_01755 [Candidatus Woesearchaeota archaeon]